MSRTARLDYTRTTNPSNQPKTPPVLLWQPTRAITTTTTTTTSTLCPQTKILQSKKSPAHPRNLPPQRACFSSLPAAFLSYLKYRLNPPAPAPAPAPAPVPVPLYWFEKPDLPGHGEGNPCEEGEVRAAPARGAAAAAGGGDPSPGLPHEPAKGSQDHPGTTMSP